MSAAPKFAPQEQVYIGGPSAAPAARPVSRPAPKKKVNPVRFLAIGTTWAVFMILCFMLVQKNVAIRSANADISRMRESIAKAEQLSLELEGKIANQVSVAEVEKWARTHGMQPPSGVVHTLQGKEDAVAVRPAPAPTPSQPAAAAEEKSFWQSLLGRFTGASHQMAGAR